MNCAEYERLRADQKRAADWKRWGPYLSERQWGTVREDYSEDAKAWTYFGHEQASRRAYRWGEDGLLGICDRQCRLCFSVALHNGKDPILKERLFGLTGIQGNHGEDVKELYYYLDATPTSSYLKGLYKYPQRAFPYQRLVDENARRGRNEPEFELLDTGVFDEDRYFDVFVEYAKQGPNDILIRIEAINRGPEPAPLSVLPTLWFRNSWAWGRQGDGYHNKPGIVAENGKFQATHETLGRFSFESDGTPEQLLTDNETNRELLFSADDTPRYAKGAFHDAVIQGKWDALRKEGPGTKAAFHHRRVLAPGERGRFDLRLRATNDTAENAFSIFDEVFSTRRHEADVFYRRRTAGLSEDASNVARQAYAGLLWSKQFYHYIVKDWLEGDPTQPAQPASRETGRNRRWTHFFSRDVISMPDKWEYPWFAAWDLAFHMIPMANIDPEFARQQLLLFLREWTMHPNGQIPAYEYGFGDVNPPVHAWAVLRVHQQAKGREDHDEAFLAKAFHKLLLNFTWWVNRTDHDGNNLFGGGFLGLDNIGVFDRSKALPTGGHLEQADGTAWMAFYCTSMLAIALELASDDPVYEDIASKFLEHFVAIADAVNHFDGEGLWDKQEAFYYDRLHTDQGSKALRIRSMVGLVPLFACHVLEESTLQQLPSFKKRMLWFLAHRPDLGRHITFVGGEKREAGAAYLLSIASRDKLDGVLKAVFDEEEFLSPFGVRALSKRHEKNPFVFEAGGEEHVVAYTPGESESYMFGGNSNWRGPVWFPVNHLLIESLETYGIFFGDEAQLELPRGSGRRVTLSAAATDLAMRLSRLLCAGAHGVRPAHGDEARYAKDPHFRDLVLFYEYFHGDNGRGLGASHQTGWTALVVNCLDRLLAGGDR